MIKFNEGIRVEEKLKCGLCKCEGLLLYEGIKDRLFNAPGIWDYYYCPNCGLIREFDSLLI